MKILLTGASGFVGMHVQKVLHSRGHQTTIVRRQPRVSQGVPGSSIGDSDDYVFDLDGTSTEIRIETGRYDALIHIAWSGLPNYRSDSHLAQIPRHLALIDAAVTAGIRNVIAIGTCFEYGMQSGSLSETSSPDPVLPYAVAKNTLRTAIADWQRTRQFSLRWIRLFYLYGAGQAATSLLPKLDAAIAVGQPVFPLSGGAQLRDYLDIATAAERIVRIAELQEFDGILNVCSGKPVLLRDFVRAFAKQRNSSIELQFGMLPYPDYEPMEFWGDTSKYHRICKYG